MDKDFNVKKSAEKYTLKLRHEIIEMVKEVTSIENKHDIHGAPLLHIQYMNKEDREDGVFSCLAGEEDVVNMLAGAVLILSSANKTQPNIMLHKVVSKVGEVNHFTALLDNLKSMGEEQKDCSVCSLRYKH